MRRVATAAVTSTDTAARVRRMLQAGGTTAAQVVAALGVSRPTADKYIKLLRKIHRDAIAVRRERVSARGPKSRVYYMVTNRRTK